MFARKFLDRLDHVPDDALEDDEQAPAARGGVGTACEEVVGEPGDRMRHVRRCVVRPCVRDRDAVASDDGESGHEGRVEARGTGDRVNLVLFTVGSQYALWDPKYMYM